MSRLVGKDRATPTFVQPSQITGAVDTREEQPVKGKKKRRRRRKSHSRKKSTAEVLYQDSAAVTADQSHGSVGSVEADGREEEHEAGAVASATGHAEPISAGAAPAPAISLPVSVMSPVSNTHEMAPQGLSITAQQITVPTGIPSYPAGAGLGSEIQPPSVSSSTASIEQEKQRQGSVSDEPRPAPKVSARKVSLESRLVRGPTMEGLKSQSSASLRFSSVAKKDGATSTARWPEEDSDMGSRSGSRTGDKYTQTGDVIMYPRRSPFDRRRPEVTRFVSPDESLSDILCGRDVISPSSTTASWSSPYPTRSRESSISEGTATSRFPRKTTAVKGCDFDSFSDMPGSESIISLKQPAVKQEPTDIPALPEKNPMQKCPASRQDTDVIDMVKNLLTENAAARAGEGCHDVDRRIGSITPPKAPLNIPKPTRDEVGADVQVGVEVGEVEEFYEEVAEEALNDSRRSSIGASCRERLDVPKSAAVCEERAQEDGQQGTDLLKGNKKNSKRYFRRERHGPVEDFVSATGQVNATDVTKKALPSSMTGEEPNTHNTLPDMAIHTETSNKHSRKKEEPVKLGEGTSMSRTTSGQHGETNLPANVVAPPSSHSACVHSNRKSSKDVDEVPRIPGKCGENRNAGTSASIGAPHEFRFEQQADTPLEVQTYSVAQRPFGCICDDFQGYSQSAFLYSPPSSPYQFGEAALSSPNWLNTPIPGTSQAFAGPWPLLDPQSGRSRPTIESLRDNQGTQVPQAAYVRNLNFQAVTKSRAMPTRGYENVVIRAEKVAANDFRSDKSTVNDFATGTTRHEAQRGATPRRSISIDPKHRLLYETDDFTEQTPLASRKASTPSVASGQFQVSRKASTASIDAGISLASRKASIASVQTGILHASRKPSTASIDFARLQTGSKSGSRKATSTGQEMPCSTSRLRCDHSSPARGCQSRKCHHGGHHTCGGHSHCRTAKGRHSPPSPPEEPMTTADGNDAALVRLEELLREENRLLRQENLRREEQLRLRPLMEERDKLLSALKAPAKDGQGTQKALRGQANTASKALPALDLTSGSPACRPNGQRGAKGVGPIREDKLQDKTACSARGKSAATRPAGTSSDSSSGKPAQRLHGNSRKSKRGKS